MPDSDYGPAAYERWRAKQDKLKRRKRVLKEIRRTYAESGGEVLLDAQKTACEMDRDRLGEGFDMLDMIESDELEEREPPEDRLFR